MKKLLKTLCLCVLALACVFVFSARAQAATEGDYTYLVTDGKAAVTGYTGKGGDITIPSTLGGYPVTAIEEYAFFICDNLTSVIIPSSVTSIGAEAFSNCDSLTSVTIGSGVRTIGQRAFFECTNLRSVKIPNSVTTIGSFAFSGCGKLATVTVGNGVTEIGSYAFNNCNNLKSLTLGKCVAVIGANAFYNCDKLTAVTIPDSVKDIDAQAFYDCNNLKTLTLGDGVINIGKLAFSKCGLTEVTIPASVTVIEEQAFYGCDSLTGFAVDKNNARYSSDKYGVLYDKNKTVLLQAHSGISGSYTVPSSVITIGSAAFRNCANLTSVKIPDSVVYIYDEAFYNCYQLEKVTIGKGATAIDEEAFDGCDSLTQFTVAKSNPKYATDDRGVLFNKDKTALLLAPNGLKGGYTVPDSVVIIDDQAFEDCYGLTAVAIGKNVTTIGERAFYYCDSITAVVIPVSLKTVEEDAFNKCLSFTVYYAGTKTQWKRIEIEKGNGILTSSAITYNHTYKKPKITTQPNNVAAPAGQKVKVTLKATGEGLQYVWYYQRANATKYTKAGSVKNYLNITMADKWEDCQVYCVVTDKYGTSVKSEVVTLHVGNPAKITTQPKNVAAPAGQKVKVTLKATGDGLQYAWYYQRANATKYTKAGSVKNYLNITMADKWEDCQVYCVVTDKYGTSVKSEVVTLHVGNPAKITTQPKNVAAPAGQKVKVTLKATGEGLQYAWYYQRANATKYTKAGSVKNYLNITMADKWEDCQVYCVVTDKYGTSVKSEVVTITMK